MTDETPAIVLKRYSGFYYVQDPTGAILECKLRGKLKKSVVLTGDRVRVTVKSPGEGMIEEILPRTNELTRPPIANVDCMMIVVSYSHPSPSMNFLDRLLVHARHLDLDPLIVMNKADLSPTPEAEEVLRVYQTVGYPVYLTSARTGQGIQALLDALKGRIAVQAGPSGVGKSSLMNRLIDADTMKTGEISSKLGRGKHTTRHVELIPLPVGGWLADAPGFSVLELPEMKRVDLAGVYREFDAFMGSCRFADCIHAKEIECGVKQAVETGEIPPERYKNYLAFLEILAEKEKIYR